MGRSRFFSRFDTKLKKALAIIVLVVAIPYWISATVATLHTGGFCEFSCGPPVHYLPWPEPPPEICQEYEAELDPIDRIICFLIITGLFLLVVIAEILLVAWIGGRIEERIAEWKKT